MKIDFGIRFEDKPIQKDEKLEKNFWILYLNSVFRRK